MIASWLIDRSITYIWWNGSLAIPSPVCKRSTLLQHNNDMNMGTKSLFIFCSWGFLLPFQCRAVFFSRIDALLGEFRVGGGVYDSYTLQCRLVGSFTSPDITPDRRDQRLLLSLLSLPKDTGNYFDIGIFSLFYNIFCTAKLRICIIILLLVFDLGASHARSDGICHLESPCQ